MAKMLESWLNAFWFFLPAGVANMTPVLAAKLPLLKNWNTPLDFGLSYNGHRVFGANKTWRGLASGMFTAGLTALLLSLFVYNALPEDRFWFTAAGVLMGFGALAGDAIESYFKRQAKVPPGHSWFPFDQTDYIIGGLLVILPFIQWSFTLIGQVFALYFGLHLLTVYVFYKLGVRAKPI